MLRVFAIALLPLVCGVAASQEADPVEIIVSATVTESSLSRNALRAIFGMRLRNWPNGNRIRVFVLPDRNLTNVVFCKQLLNIYPHQLRLAWDRLVFSGTGQAPTEVDSEEEMRALVATTAGAIGYLRRSLVNDSVRVLEIQ